jgi:hypothetical protein
MGPFGHAPRANAWTPPEVMCDHKSQYVSSPCSKLIMRVPIVACGGYDMTSYSRLARNVTVGTAIAWALAASSVRVLASVGDCSTTCAPGTPLQGFPISCDCMGPGHCNGVIEGYAVSCSCDDWPTTYCNCTDGCS